MKKVTIRDTKSVNGEVAVAVEVNWEPEGYPGATIRLNYWFSPSKGFALVQSERWFRPTAKHAMRLAERVRCWDFAKHGRLWLPAKAEFELILYDEKGYDPDREFTAKFSEWSVDNPVTGETFSVAFPDGTMVRDDIRGMTYMKGGIHDALVKSQVARVNAQQPQPLVGNASSQLQQRFEAARRDNPYGPDSNRGVWAAAAGVIAVLALASLAASRWGWWRKAGGAR